MASMGLRELMQALGRSTPAFEVAEFTLFNVHAFNQGVEEKTILYRRRGGGLEPGHPLRDYLLRLIAPSEAYSALTASDHELVNRETARITRELERLYREIGPPPNWTGGRDGE